ncbi:MAG TPA: HD domain-containing phosphohydrolase [bacterium]|nr:HD domain-containing phosphohydrolase [bacterium]
MEPERIEATTRSSETGDTRAGGSEIRELRLRAELMKRLVGLSEGLNRPSSVAGVASATGQAAAELGAADRVAVYLRAPNGVVTCQWSQGLSPIYVAEIATPSGSTPWAHLAKYPELACMELPKGRRASMPEPTLIEDTTDLPPGNSLRRRAEREGFRAVASWPLIHEGRATAAVACYYNAPRQWSAAEREAMQALAWQAAAALENGRSYEAQGRRTAELEALYELSRRLRYLHTAEEMYPIVVDHAVRLVRGDHGALGLLSPDSETLVNVHTWGVAAEHLGTGAPVSAQLARLFRTAAPFVTADLSADQAIMFGGPAMHQALGPFAAVALRAEQDVIGTLSVGRARGALKEPFVEADVRLLKSVAEMAGTAIHRSRLHQDLQDSYIDLVRTLVRALDARDAYTSGHSERLAEWCEATARLLGCNDDNELQLIRWGALLHDIGKIAVPDAILRKPAELTEAEWAVMYKHPITGEEILKPVERMRAVSRVLRHHHERWDGSGYPDGLRGEAIPLSARILAVVDAYSAIRDERPYKPARSHHEAMIELRRAAGAQFDPRVVEAFCRMLEQRGEPEAA